MTTKKILVLALLALAGCSSNQRMMISPRSRYAVTDLLKNLPAENATYSSLITEALLDQRETALPMILRQLDSDSSAQSTNAHYALDALAHYCGRLASGDQRRTEFVTAIGRSLAEKHRNENQAFLITLLQICPDDEAIQFLQPFLMKEESCEPAAAALQVLATPLAAQTLANSLANNTTKNKLTLINQLGQMADKETAPALLEYAKSENPTLKASALFGLAQMAWMPAETLLHESALADDHYGIPYLTLAQNMADENRSAEIARAILNQKEKKWPDAIRLQALNLLVKKIGVRAMPELRQIALNDSISLRIPALNLAEPFTATEVTEKWIAALATAPPPVQADILAMLGRQKATQAVPAMRQHLQSDHPAVRQSAINALTHTLDDAAVSDLLTVLQNTTDSSLQRMVKQNLLTLPHQPLHEAWDRVYPGLANSGKTVLLEIALARHDSSRLNEMAAALKSDDAGLREVALEGLRTLGKETEFSLCLDHLRSCASAAEIKLTQSCLVDILKRTPKPSRQLAELNSAFQAAPVEQKKNLLRVYRSLGNDASLKMVQQAAKEDNLKEEALRTLCDWPDVNALEPLLELAASKEEQTVRILALRGALRLVRENPMGDLRQLQYLQQMMKCCDRPEEKKMVLAEAGKIKSISALKFAAGFVKEESIGHEAAVAVVQIAKPDQKNADALAPEEVAAALLSVQAGTKLLQQMTEAPLLSSSLNQPPEGFIALFNGRDLDGWKGLVEDPVKRSRMSAPELSTAQLQADQDMRQHWQVIDGVLYFDGKGHSLCTHRDYTDFELYVDWKIERLGDSGIYLRGSPQVQIWDPAQWPEGSGGLYNNQKNPSKPLVKADRPVGEWNTFHIIMQDERVTVYLNDILVVDHVMMENYWQRDRPIYRSGQIELQAHSTPLYFRNIFIKELPPLEPAFNGLLFNGKNLEGWQVINGKPESWQVEDGILFTTGKGGGWLSTTREFQDFRLELEFRVPADGNSGVFIRSPHQGDPAYSGMEIQVLDDYAAIYSKLKPWQYTGSIYGVQAPAQLVSKSAGQWQKMVITCMGARVQVDLNGIKTIDANLIEHMDKCREHPGLQRRGGYIGLQNHSTRLEYRNIKLEELR